ncbi:DUF2189 domain-containing protein [Acidovorax sp.]|uniref:DUF2189 domain-containing protein n=1 Tax=Acidovorax sp. TaxID=1872122 RepID=UPI0025C04610|nr:DUF2189 domain-containing protein [Acidovorax sp.]MCI5070998.1 DUF2189 domain-containing protein [Acidovorax sp.]
MPRKPPPPLPPVRTIRLVQPMVWLVLAWRDMARAGWISFAHGLAVTLVGGAMLSVAHHRFWLLAGALSGFLAVAPVLATGLYALSRALERGEPANLGVVTTAWLNWQKSHRDKWSGDYWCMVRFGALLALAATGWVMTSAALITLLAPVPIETPVDFLRHVVMAREGWLFELWLGLGSLMAAPIFASSVVAMPMLLDRRTTVLQAVLTSWQAVVVNPLPMAFWAALILGFTLLGLGSLLLGLVAVLPMLGHASWHAYRDLVDASGLPQRETTASEAAAVSQNNNGVAR